MVAGVKKDKDGYVLWDLPEETVLLMVLMGFARLAADGIHEFTPEGEKWIRDYCEGVLRLHQSEETQ